MAVTKLWKVSVRLGQVLDYTTNPEKTANPEYSPEDYQALKDVLAYAKDEEKTEHEFFCDGINCNVAMARDQFITVKEQFGKTDGIQAYHGYLSFKENEVTPEQAQQIGMEFARKMWGKEVRMELEELISDMYADRGSMEEVLTELGDPAEFAKQYQNEQKYLIGPEYFDTYLWFVKVVLICAAVPILIISLINAIGEIPAITSQNAASVIIRAIVDGLIVGITDAMLSCISAFGAVTLTFAIMERKKIQIEMKKAEKWSVESLSEERKIPSARWTPKILEPVPDKKAIISRGDSIVGIVFIVIFSVLLIFAPHFFAAIFTEGEAITTVPVFNLEQWGIVLPVFVISLLIGLIDEILRLIIGVYCKLVMISNILCGVIQIVLSAIVLKVLPIWNPNFVLEIEQALGANADSSANFFTYWNADMVSNGLLAFIVVITLFEIGVTIYKTLRYGVSVKNGINSNT